MKYTRDPDGLTLTSPNGTATIRPTPSELQGENTRPWMADVNGTFQDTYDTEEVAITACKEILELKP